jgi:hypothetical protein
MKTSVLEGRLMIVPDAPPMGLADLKVSVCNSLPSDFALVSTCTHIANYILPMVHVLESG